MSTLRNHRLLRLTAHSVVVQPCNACQSRLIVLDRPAGGPLFPANGSIKPWSEGELVRQVLSAIAAFVVDNRPGRHTFQYVAALNFAGVAPVVMGLWQGGLDMDGAVAHLVNPFNLLAMFGAAPIGWGLVWLAPILTTVFVQTMLQYRANRLRAEDDAPEQDWDFAPLDET